MTNRKAAIVGWCGCHGIVEAGRRDGNPISPNVEPLRELGDEAGNVRVATNSVFIPIEISRYEISEAMGGGLSIILTARKQLPGSETRLHRPGYLYRAHRGWDPSKSGSASSRRGTSGEW